MTLLGIESWSKYAGSISNTSSRGWVLGGSPTLISTDSRWGGTYDYSVYLNASNESMRMALGTGEDDVIIVGCAVRFAALDASDFIRFSSDADATIHLSLCLKADGALEVRRGTGSGTILATSAAGLITIDNWHYVCFKAKLDNSVGTVDVRVDGDDVITATGLDTRNAGTKTVFDFFSLECAVVTRFTDVMWCNEQGSTNNTMWDDVRIAVLSPDGNGTTSQLVGSDADSTDNYLLVDDTATGTLSSADYVGSATDEQKDTYAMSALPVAAGTIYGVVAYAWAAKTDAGAKSIALVSRESGGTEEDGTTQALTTSYAWYSQVFEDDPDAATWTTTSINAAEFGAKVKA